MSTLYKLLMIGFVGTFLGHGVFAVRAKTGFIELLVKSFARFGLTISDATGALLVIGIGAADLAVAAFMTYVLVTGKYAYSRTVEAIVLWGAVWGFATAFSRVTALGSWWDWVERAPNFMLPLALLMVIYNDKE